MAAELSPEDIRNGWTEKSLAEYLAERERVASDVILGRKKSLPRTQNSRYNPHKWR